jgi:hypothetical protein
MHPCLELKGPHFQKHCFDILTLFGLFLGRTDLLLFLFLVVIGSYVKKKKKKKKKKKNHSNSCIFVHISYKITNYSKKFYIYIYIKKIINLITPDILHIEAQTKLPVAHTFSTTWQEPTSLFTI